MIKSQHFWFRPQYPSLRKCRSGLLAVSAFGFLSLGLSACASLSTVLPDISNESLKSEQRLQEVRVFENVKAQTARLHTVGSKILLANPDLCPKTAPYAGVYTHRLTTYRKALRPAAKREMGAQTLPTVKYVVPGGPADLAGLKIGDQLLSPRGKSVARYKKTRAEPDTLTRQGLSFRRNGEKRSTEVQPVQACDYVIRRSDSAAINAYADGRHITVTAGMLDFVNSDEELALIIGHELAHNTMGHIRKIVGNTILSGFAKRYTRPFESESDYVGLYYMARAGFDINDVEDVWRRLATVNPKSVARAKSHPSFPDRYVRIAATRDEINAKRKAGLPLLPNFIQEGSDTGGT